jgi:hypothetical protein
MKHEWKGMPMRALEFETTITQAGHIELPPAVAGDIPSGQQLKVVVMWDSESVDSAWLAAGRARFEQAYCAEDDVYEQLIHETPGR